MADFDYGNARLHAMKSRLLSQHRLETLADNASLSGLIATLAQTSYRKPVEAALTRASGLDCINEALRLDLTGTLGNIRSFYQDQAVELVAIVLRTYDIHNLKTILRGLTKNLPPGDILPVLLPVGDLNYFTLADLTRRLRTESGDRHISKHEFPHSPASAPAKGSTPRRRCL